MNKKQISRPLQNPDDFQVYLDDVNFPALVSFPRCGCHWITMLMELYFNRPFLELVYYLHDRIDYMGLHSHDHGLFIKKKSIIYLYRNPVDVLYSLLQYYQEDMNDITLHIYWLDLYIKHLNK